MPKILYTVDNLVSEVRNQLDEQNADSVSTTGDILPSLNRAKDYAFDVYARKYPEPILANTIMPLVGDQLEYDIPEYVFEDRILKIEIQVPSTNGKATYREVERASYRDISLYESSSKTNVPYYYSIIARKIRFTPAPTGTFPARVWYLSIPEQLVSQQGRITTVNTGSNYVLVDSTGDDLTTEADQLGSYVNVIDGQTGVIKGTLQIQSILNDKITFRTVPLRSTVLNRDVTDISQVEVEADDYLCNIVGTCVPYYGTPTSNFMIQFAVAEITRKLGGNAAQEEQILQKFESQIEKTWVKRETTLRVKKRSQNWGVPVRRWEWE